MFATIRGNFDAYEFIHEVQKYIDDWFEDLNEYHDVILTIAYDNSIDLVMGEEYYYELLDDIRFDYRRLISDLTIDEE